MSLLFYCIMKDRMDMSLPGISGVNGQPLFSVAGSGLRAVASEYGREGAINIAGLMAFSKVVEACQELTTIIPMRFGCVLSEKKQLFSHLNHNRIMYEEILKKLHGCVEMGIRIMDTGTPPRETTPPDPSGSQTSGLSFLNSRKSFYSRIHKLTWTQKQLADDCRKLFSGLCKSFKVEQSPVLSLYFLIPGDSVEAFQQTFGRLMTSTKYKMLLSGPWPPYNFVP